MFAVSAKLASLFESDMIAFSEVVEQVVLTRGKEITVVDVEAVQSTVVAGNTTSCDTVLTLVVGTVGFFTVNSFLI